MSEPDEILKLPYRMVLIQDETGFAAEIQEFPGCYAQGDTADEAIHNLIETAKGWILACQGQGQKIPEPLANNECSGRVLLRLLKSQHRQAIKAADEDGVSLNQFIVVAVAEKLMRGSQ